MRSNGLKWADLIVSLALLIVLGTAAIAQLANSEEIANRVKCASNLRQIAQAMLLYANDNRGGFPRALASKLDGAAPVPTWGTPYEGNPKLKPVPVEQTVKMFFPDMCDVAPKPNDVTAAMFLLIRTQDITSEAFICPSTGLKHFDYGGGSNSSANVTNWLGNSSLADHLSYSVQNPYPSKDAIGKGSKWNLTLGAEFAVAADMNPGIDALLKLTPRSAPDALRKGNSPNHDGDGQNVLYGDGHVAYEQTPFVGIDQDNIYTYGMSGRQVKDKGGDGIVGSPVGADDSILLPTAKDLGVVDADGALTDAAKKRRGGDFKTPAPAEQAAAQQKIAGTYMGDQGQRKIKMTITDKQIAATSGPIAITFDYKVTGINGEQAQLELTAPDTPATHILVNFEPDGISIRKSAYFEGTWKRQ